MAFEPDVSLKFLAALLPLLNPLYGIPIFLSMTEGYSPAERNRTALIASVAATVAALVATLMGEEGLGVFGIDIPSFRIAGGIIILGIALAMLNADAPAPGDAKAASEGHARRRNIAVVPLAIPLTIGPGAIATAIVFAHQLDEAGEVVTLVPVVPAARRAGRGVKVRRSGAPERSRRRRDCHLLTFSLEKAVGRSR